MSATDRKVFGCFIVPRSREREREARERRDRGERRGGEGEREEIERGERERGEKREKGRIKQWREGERDCRS